MNYIIPKELREAISNNKLIVFAGSGLSKKFNLPDWEGMVIDVINNIEDDSLKPFVSLLKSKKMQPIDVLEGLQDNKKDIHLYIKNNFTINEDNNLATHKKIVKLTSKIVTTNYDNAFEKADNKLSTVYYFSPFNINNIKSDERFLFKLHGCSASDASKCVIFKKDYEDLYSNENAAILKLKDLFINNTILFIGFGFKDPYVNTVFSNLDRIFEGYNKHFVLTPNPDEFKEFSYIKAIKLESHIDIESILDQLLDIKNQNIEPFPSTTALDPVTNSLGKPKPKIACLYPEPVDTFLGQDLSKAANSLNNLDAEIYKGYLNLRSLQLIDDYEYLFIFTKHYKNKIYIEGENLESALITIEELNKNILNDKTIRVLVTDEEIEVTTQSPFVHITNLKSAIITKFLFKALRNSDLNFIEKEIRVQNIDKTPQKVEKGKSRIISLYGDRPPLSFSQKASHTIVGRVEEQSMIANRVIKIIDSNKLLNIKGSGGLGKTTLIKKVSYDLYQRGYFDRGVSFISCENVKSYNDFEDELIRGFKLQSILNFKEYLIENQSKLDLLIILDNFETVSNLTDKEDFNQVLKLIEFATDYASIVITSRESLLVDFEDVFTLGTLITDDAQKLFLQNYQGNVKDEEIKTLRSDILENLLNNNPLAIKLVTKTVAQYRTVVELRDQLNKHFFESTSEEFNSIYRKDADLNIERTKSIYQSINYSYSKLTSKQKLAFEILHLFPDGISLPSLKFWFNKQKQSANNISDTELRHLQDKSLIENYEGQLQLQPIIRRFAEFQFSKRNKDTKQKYYNDAYSWNGNVLKYLEITKKKKSLSVALHLHESVKNNLMLVLDYMDQVEISEKSPVHKKSYFLNYINTVKDFVVSEKQVSGFQEKLKSLVAFFSDMPNAKIFLEVLHSYMTYYNKNFNNAYETLSSFLPPQEIEERKFQSEEYIENLYKGEISHIHSMEGFTINYVNSFIRNDDFSNYLSQHFFYLGIFDFIGKPMKGFYEFEKDFNKNSLNIDELKKYINSLFVEEHLEEMQCTYILSKAIKLKQEKIKKLVITNPYTKGLKELMFAFNETDLSKRKKHFENALKSLYHIKYYYIEALYFYSEFLNVIDDPSFHKIYNEGLELSSKYYYQYLEFKFRSLINSDSSKYNCSSEYYPVKGIVEYLHKHNEEWKRIYSQKEYLNV
ncbi:hypothetical protein GCM10023188_21130 [Pontibacter saemangeumensis]|uniref:SIR2-like domain-containing protein n=1 Tax=Pontibacter saemangeumensis TaxID=1084525 RepID=A0ABP8LMJ4_9BACT